MSLKSRLLFSFSMMIALTVFLGAMLIGSTWVIRARTIEYNRARQLYDLLSEISQTFEKQRRSVDAYLIGVESEKEQFRALESETARLLARWKDLTAYPVEKEELRKVQDQMVTWTSSLSQVFRLAETGRRTEAIRVMEESVLGASDRVQKELKALSIAKKNGSDRAWSIAQRVASRVTGFSLLLLGSVVLAGSGFSLLIYQSVTRPLAQLREVTQKIAKGEWDLRLDLDEPEELAELARAFEEMSKSLKQLQSQVVQMDRMSAVGTLAGGVAHEINNPLTGVLGQAQLLLAKLPEGDPNRSNVEKIERAAQRCRKIVRGLLDFSRPKEFIFEPADADEMVSGALALCETEIAAMKIEVDWKKNPRLPRLLASPHHLQQVFLNITANAMHAMPKGGTLTIRTRVVEDEEGAGRLAEVAFTDTGEGIPPENIPKLFDAFFTTKDPGKGTGLGLTISYGIVQQHKGRIAVRSEGKGKGTTFAVQIPAAPEGLV